MSTREALHICLRPEHLRRTLTIALVVGTIMTIVNQADVILGGEAATTGTWIKAVFNYCAPVVVSSLGLLAGKRAEAVLTRRRSERARATRAEA